MIWHAKHAKSRGVWGHAPPQKILKPSEIEFEDTFNDLLLLLFQDSMHIAKQLMYIWLNSTKSRGSGKF